MELEPGKGVWFCSEDLLEQVREFKKLADYISTNVWDAPYVRHIVRYDNAPSHRKRGPTALSANRMRKGIGLPTATVTDMRDTEFTVGTKTKQQHFKFKKGDNKGKLKGCLIIGQERGLWDEEGFAGMGAQRQKVLLPEMRVLIGDQPDFRDEQSLLQELHDELSTDDAPFPMIYAPKFHCELQLSIERAWGTAKGTCRETCDYTITALKAAAPAALDGIKPEMFRQWQRAEMVYEQAYREGATILTVEGRVQEIKKKTYKSHRAAPAAPPAEGSRKRQIGAISASRIATEIDMVLEPDPTHKEWVRQMLPIWDDESECVCRLVHVAWNVESGGIQGWFYECESFADPMPMRGKYVDTDRCLYASIADIEPMHDEDLAKKKAGTLPWT